MKKSFLTFSFCAGLAALAPLTVHAQVLYSNNFEGATPFAGMTSDQVTAVTTPNRFGSSNQYVDLNDGSASPPRGQLISSQFTTATSGVYTGSFAFNEITTANRNDDIRLGFGNSNNLALGTGSRISSFTINNGALSFGTATETLSVDTSYSFALFVNTTGTAVSNYYQGRTLAAGTGDLYFTTFGGAAGSYTYIGTASNTTPTAGNPTAAQYFGAYTSSNADLQRVALDNYRVFQGIDPTVVPEPSSALLLGIGASLVLLRRRRLAA